MKLISTRKPKSKYRKTCPEISRRGFIGYNMQKKLEYSGEMYTN
jgi:hypothetical protein